jgi:lipoate-protein ligase B
VTGRGAVAGFGNWSKCSLLKWCDFYPCATISAPQKQVDDVTASFAHRFVCFIDGALIIPNPAKIFRLNRNINRIAQRNFCPRQAQVLIDYEPTLHAVRSEQPPSHVGVAPRPPNPRVKSKQLEHPPVFTPGLGRRSRNVMLQPGSIPVIKVERGGTVTYHGLWPIGGEAYLLLDTRRSPSGSLASKSLLGIEQSLISCLQNMTWKVIAKVGMPGGMSRQNALRQDRAAVGLRICQSRHVC